MRRIFIMRKDLHLTAGKLAAMVGHAAELYWLNLLKSHQLHSTKDRSVKLGHCDVVIPSNIWTEYVNGIYTKTICEARNLNQLLKAKAIADKLGLKENEDYGFINDKCLTELKPENEDGTTTVGMWFAPLADDTAHQISKKFPLYRDHNHVECQDKVTGNFDLTKDIEGMNDNGLKKFGDCSSCCRKNTSYCQGCLVPKSDGEYGRQNYLPQNGTYIFSTTKGEN